MEVQGAPGEDDDLQRSRCFPIPLLGCCPGSITRFVPTTWQKIQDRTHLALVLGVIGSVLLVGDTAKNIIQLNLEARRILKGVLSLCFVLPCLLYFVRIIGQYDDRLQAKQRDAKEQKEQLTKAYNNLLADMDGLLTKSAESSAGLAERSFESKRRDFQRFLERAKSRYSQLFDGNKLDSQKLMENFRRFVLNWLKVFEECSISPIHCPKIVVTADELQRCVSIAEVCDLTLERLRVTEVKFISIQREQDTQILRKHRNDFRRLTATPDARTLAALENGSLAGGPRALTTELAATGSQTNRCSWLTCGRGTGGFRMITSQTEDGYPKDLQFGCGRLVMLSREHARLLTGFAVGWLILALEFWMRSENPVPTGVLEVLLVEICLIVLLTRFEEIDVIQQLEREVAELKKAESNVQNQREKMHDFWSQAQNQTELWLYRTVPRMDLYKEVHSHLEDAPNESINQWMQQANDQLSMIEHNLGKLEDWCGEGSLSLDQKKTFGKTINSLCQEQEFEHLSKKLADISRNGMRCLEAPPPENNVVKSSPRGPVAGGLDRAKEKAQQAKEAAQGGLQKLGDRLARK